MLFEDPIHSRIAAMHKEPWFRAVGFLQRCCPRLDLQAYVERCSGVSPEQQLVSHMH